MKAAILKLVVILVLLVAAELAYFRIAARFNIVDTPNERSSHKKPTLRGGGIIFYAAILLYYLFFGISAPWFLLGATLIAAVSFIDDIRPVPNRIRIAIHFISILLMFWQVGVVGSFPWWWLVFAVIVAAGVINAFNFMDGINGMTAGYSLAVLIPLLWIDVSTVEFTPPEFIYTMLLSVVVFGFFNFRKNARCFAGDVGAVSMAFVVISLLTTLIVRTGDVTYIILLAVYGVDTTATIIRRLWLRENIFTAHRKHLYQLLSNGKGIPQPRVSSLYALTQAAVTGVYLLLPAYHWQVCTGAIVVLAGVYIMLLRNMKCK